MTRLPRLNYANVMSTFAVFLALGGTSYAAVKLKKGSVTSREVKDASLQAEDLAPSAKFSGPRGPRGDQGPAGPAGGKGDQGDKGDRGPSGPSNVRLTSGPLVGLAGQAGATKTILAMRDLPAGQYLVTFTAEATLRVAGAGMYVVCQTRVNGAPVSVTKGIVGDAYGGDAGLSDMVTVNKSSAFDLTLECYADQTSNPAPSIDHPKLAAIKVDTATAS